MGEPSQFQGAARSKMLEQDHQRHEGSASLIQSLETDLDDLRVLVTCRICIRPLYEPYTIACGHTFCYSCLRQWFERDRIQKTCPDCRTKVIHQPAPAYLVRDMTQIFINRAELMPEGETTEDHRKWQQEEAEIIEKDKKATSDHSRGLFRGCFLLSPRRNVNPIRDTQDGIDRCPRCTWELEDGYCVSCEYHIELPDTEGSVGSESPTISSFTDEEASRRRHEIRNFYAVRREPGSEQGGDIEGYSGLSNDSEEDSVAVAAERDRRRRFGAGGPPRPSSSDRIRYTATPQAYNIYSEAGTSDAEFEDTDDFSAEDDETGSLDDFVVNDVDERHPPGHSPRSSHYDSEEVSSIIDQFRTYSSEDEEHGHRVDERGDQTSELRDNPPFSPIYLESDSDEGPIIRSRRHGYQRSTVSPRPSSSDGSEVIASAENYIRSRRDRRQRNDPTSARRLSKTHRHTSNDARGSERNNGFRGVAIDIESDSDSSSPPQNHPRKRRTVSRRILSDDDDDEAATASVDSHPVTSRPSSSGTATVGRASPTKSSVREYDLQPAYQTFHAASPIVINSTPISHDVPRYDLPSYHESTASPEPRTTRPGSARSSNDRSRRSNSLGNRFEQRRHLQSRSPRQPSNPDNPESSTPTSPPTSSRLSNNSARGESVRYHHITRDRAARKAERQQAKQDRRRRERDRANASGSSRPPASPDASEIMNLDGGVQFVNRHRLAQG